MKLRRYQNGLTIALIIFIITVYLLIKMQMNGSEDQINPINQLRVETHSIYLEIQNYWPLDEAEYNNIQGKLEEGGISGTIATLSGNVLFSNQLLDLKEVLYMDESYMKLNPNHIKLGFPIYVNNVVDGFVIFEKTFESQKKVFLSLEKQMDIAFVVTIMLLITIVILGFKKKETPFGELISGLEAISKGILAPLPLPSDKMMQAIYIQYNILVEEFSFIIKQQQVYDGQRKAFLTTISHELKTPIATINAYVEGLITGVAKDDVTKDKYQKIIYEKMQKLMTQVDELFKYAQEESNQFKYNFVECYANELFAPIFHALSEQKNHKVQIDNHIPKCLINADPIRIEQVIMNLYNNAIKHSNSQEPILIRSYRQDDEVVVEVEDFGEGIHTKDLPYIFDYYYQGSDSKKKDYEGVGLGLAICKEILDKHGGNIIVRSKMNVGTTMRIVLPVL